jgi:hypothetical protein
VLMITHRAIRSAVTSHAAERTGDGGEDGWRVSWLAGRVLSAGQAEAAMLIAEAACDVDADCDPELYDEGSGRVWMRGPRNSGCRARLRSPRRQRRWPGS